jgi:two-component sensor histidine kinase
MLTAMAGRTMSAEMYHSILVRGSEWSIIAFAVIHEGISASIFSFLHNNADGICIFIHSDTLITKLGSPA